MGASLFMADKDVADGGIIERVVDGHDRSARMAERHLHPLQLKGMQQRCRSVHVSPSVLVPLLYICRPPVQLRMMSILKKSEPRRLEYRRGSRSSGSYWLRSGTPRGLTGHPADQKVRLAPDG